MACSCSEYLAGLFPEVAPLDFYRDLFPIGTLDKRNAMTKGKYCGIAVQVVGKNKARRFTITDELDNIEELVSSDDFTVVSPLSYAGKTQKAEAQRDCYAIAIDLDNIKFNKDGEPQGLMDLFSQIERAQILPRPTYIVASSDKNIHVYYLLEEPIHLFKSNKESLSRYKTWLTWSLWNYYITKEYKNVQQEPIGQSMRAVGSITKDKKGRVRAFKVGDRVSIEYLNSFCRDEDKHIDIWSANDSKYPRETRKDRKESFTNQSFYDWYQRQLPTYAKEGKRYFALMVLAIIARKCGISRKQLEKDALDWVKPFDELTTDKDNHFDEADALKAITAYDKQHFIFMKRETLVKLSGVPMEANKRNGRKQAQHMIYMNGMNALHKSMGESIGRPTKKELVFDYLKEHPEASVRDIARRLNISVNTACKWARVWRQESTDSNN